MAGYAKAAAAAKCRGKEYIKPVLIGDSLCEDARILEGAATWGLAPCESHTVFTTCDDTRAAAAQLAACVGETFAPWGCGDAGGPAPTVAHLHIIDADQDEAERAVFRAAAETTRLSVHFYGGAGAGAAAAFIKLNRDWAALKENAAPYGC